MHDITHGRPLLIAPEHVPSLLRYRTAYREQTSVDAAAQRGTSIAPGAIGVLPIVGPLEYRESGFSSYFGLPTYDRLARDFDSLVNDSKVSAIVLDVDSPGGDAFGMTELSDRIYAARGTKPIIAAVNKMMASAAFGICSAADEIVMSSGWIGSVGVLMMHADISGMNEQAGVDYTYIHEGQYKVEGNPDGPLGDEARQYMQAQAKEIYNQFVGTLARNRGTTPARVRSDFGQGRMLLPRDAKKAGMIDRIETIDQTMARLGGSRKTAQRRSKTLRQLAIRRYK